MQFYKLFFLFALIFHGKVHDFRVFACDIFIAVLAVRDEAVGAVLADALDIFEIAAALVAESVKRTIAEKTVELFIVCHLVTREKLTFVISEKCIVVLFHGNSPLFMEMNCSYISRLSA